MLQYPKHHQKMAALWEAIPQCAKSMEVFWGLRINEVWNSSSSSQKPLSKWNFSCTQLKTGWATDGIYTLIPSSGRALGITKNTGGDSSQVKRGKKKLKEKEIKRLKRIFPEKMKCLKDEKSWNRVQFPFFACFKFFPEGLQTPKLHNLRRWRRATAPIHTEDGKTLFPSLIIPQKSHNPFSSLSSTSFVI